MNQLPEMPPPPGSEIVGALQPAQGTAFAYARFWTRVWAFLIDGLVLAPVSVAYFLFVHDRLEAGAHAIRGIPQLGGIYTRDLFAAAHATLVVRYAYEFVMIGKWNATVGQFALGIRVRRVDGSPAEWREAALRPILQSVLSFFSMSFASLLDELWMLWDGRKQTLHDKIASTIVVYK